MSIDMSLTEGRARLPELTNKAEYAGETVYLTKHGRRCGAVVSAAAAQLLESIEDLIDADEVRAALADVAADRDGRKPFVRRTVGQT